MNRVVIKINENGEFDGVCSDVPIEFYTYCPHCKNEPVYHYRSVNVGPHEVRKWLGNHPVAYGGEDILVDQKPSKPNIEVVK